MDDSCNFEQAALIYKLLDSNKFKKIACYFNDFFRGKYAILKKLYESDEVVASGDLARDVGVSTARIAAALNTLEEERLITRVKSDEDGRITIINLTKEGEKSFIEQRNLFIKSVIHFLNKLDKAEILILTKMLETIINE